jgi:N-acetylmuramoyl-L-alanine amidase
MRAKITTSFLSVIIIALASAVAVMSTVYQKPDGLVPDNATSEVELLTAESETYVQMKTTEVEEAVEQSPSEDDYLLAKIAMAEAEGEDTEGKALVMLVVLNRVASDSFPDTIEGVIYQKGQFSPIANGRFDIVEPDADCWEALDMVRKDGWDESRGATFFESRSGSTWHSENLNFLFQHGIHYFYKEKE